MWVFKDEIKSLYDDYKYVTPKREDFITASSIKKIAEEIILNKTIHGVMYSAPNEAIEVVFYEAEPEVFYHSVFLNPYSGDFIKRVNNDTGFFGFILKGHLRLWLPDAIGSRVVSCSVLMFLIIMISGLFL